MPRSPGNAHGGLRVDAEIADFLASWFEHPGLTGTSRDQFDTYYASYLKRFGPRLRHYFNSQSREVVELILRWAEERPPALLEIGAGTGTESLWFALKGAAVKGWDINEKRLDVARDRLSILRDELSGTRDIDCEFQARSVFDLGEERFDIIWMEQTFHHLEPREEVARSLHALLRPGGVLVICESNALNPLLQLQHFNYRGFNTIGRYTDRQGNEHLYGKERILRAKTLSRLLAGVGFERERLRHFRVFPNHGLFDALLAVEDRWPGWLRFAFTHYTYVGRRV